MSNDFLYWFGFYVEYRLLCLARGLAAFTRWFVRVLGALLTAVLRPVALGCIQLRQALRRPKAWLGLVVPVAGVLAFAWLVRTWLGQPFALRVEVNGTVVGYVASEQDFDTARADVQARVNTARALLEAAGADVPDWDLDPAFTLAVSADTMTPGEVANAILQASGSEITAGTAVYVDGALRFVTTEGDHLRTLLAAVRRPYMDPADADSRVVFAHELTLADGIYLTGSVSPYTEVVSALQANDGELLRVQIRRRERYEQELAYDTQIVEDDTLDFGKSETVQTGVPGRETVTYEVVYENGAEVDSRVLDVARSREIKDCVAEARWLAGEGVKELILVAQDPTAYGEDWGKPGAVCQLLDELQAIDGIRWIRVLYAYPERITDEFIAALVRNTKVVPYLDLPIQHCDDAVLKAMNRRGGRKEIEDAIHRLRKAIPGITLRTTLIAGFPGETEEQYAELCDFVKTMKFDRLGCFAYSAEENTVAAKMDGQLDEETKQRRADHIMELQAEVSAEREGEKVGQTLECVCDGVDDETGMYLLRSKADCPEIDGNVLTPADTPLETGAFYNVTITDSDTYDLYGYVEEKLED